MSWRTSSPAEAGQATVEAAFLLPLLFFMTALLLQPAILLYDRSVMNGAASEACRLASTSAHADETAKAFVLRRLKALPSLDIFFSQGCQPAVEVQGGPGAEKATVVVEMHVKPLPLLGLSASTLTEEAGDGCALLRVEVTSALHPAWLADAEGSPEDWVSQWD